MAYIGKYLFVLLWVPYCIVYSVHSGALHKISNPGLSTARGWGGRRWWQQQRWRWVIVVIVLLYTLSHSAISVLKIMSPSNEVRPLLLFIISCHSQELHSAICLGDVFKKASLNEHIWIVMWFLSFFFSNREEIMCFLWGCCLVSRVEGCSDLKVLRSGFRMSVLVCPLPKTGAVVLTEGLLDKTNDCVEGFDSFVKKIHVLL